MTRTATGWHPSKVLQTQAEEIDEGIDDDEGMSKEDLQVLADLYSKATTPIGAQQCVRDEYVKWTKEWACECAYTDLQWPSDMQAQWKLLGPITPVMFRQAASSAPAGSERRHYQCLFFQRVIRVFSTITRPRLARIMCCSV